jgi:ABC-2 type transport system permease protein
MPTVRKPPSVLTQLIDLILIELTNWRWSWRGLIVISTVAPLASMAALGIFARDLGDEALSYVFTGNIVLSLLFGIEGNVQSHFMFMRLEGVLDYFATLPVKKLALLTAVIIAFFLLALPAILGTIFIGSWLLDISLNIHPLLIVVIPLCALPISGIGALIGLKARNYPEAGSINLLLTFALLALGPVVIPPSRLPHFLLVLGQFSPTTYASSALRQVLLEPVTAQLAVDMAALVAFTAVSFMLVGRLLQWRRDQPYR